MSSDDAATDETGPDETGPDETATDETATDERPHVRAYVDEPVGDVDVATTAAREAAVRFGVPAPRLLRASMNAVFVSGDEVLRVARPSVAAEVSLQLAWFLDGIGVRIALPARDEVVRSNGLQVTCWRRLRPVDRPVDWAEVGRQVRRIWSVEPTELPDGVALPRPVGFPWWRLDAILEDLREVIEPSTWETMADVVRTHRHRLDPDPAVEVVCHGDVHPGNVVVTAGGPVLVDWDLLCLAPPAWDHTALLRWSEVWGGVPGAYESFAEGAGVSLRGDPDAEGIAELRLIAAATMAVRRSLAAADDPDAAAEAARRLARWRPGAAPERWHAR